MIIVIPARFANVIKANLAVCYFLKIGIMIFFEMFNRKYLSFYKYPLLSSFNQLKEIFAI